MVKKTLWEKFTGLKYIHLGKWRHLFYKHDISADLPISIKVYSSSLYENSNKVFKSFVSKWR